jgi:ATP-dependent Lon protease
MTNNIIVNENFVNTDDFKKIVDELFIKCSDKSMPSNIYNNITRIKDSLTQNITPSKELIIDVLTELCPQKISSLVKMYNISDKYKICEDGDNCEKNNNYFSMADEIFNCVSAEIKPISYYLDNKDNYYEINKYLDNDSEIPYTYFNTNVPQESRIVSTKNEKKDSKNTITLKIKNEDLCEDLLAIRILIKLKYNKNESDMDDRKILCIKAFVKNDAYGSTKNSNFFRTHYKNNTNQKYEKLYNKVHLRDCCLNSFNGEEPFEYIAKVYNAVSSCNDFCLGIKDKKDSNESKENNKKSNHGSCNDSSCNSKHEHSDDSKHNDISMVDFIKSVKSIDITTTEQKDCNESSHYIQKFAKYCFHTKYLIFVHTAEVHQQVCLFLALILVKCNNRLCREFLDTLPFVYKQMIMNSGCIAGHDESKTDVNANDKESLSDKIIFWKMHAKNYGLNVKKLIDKCKELTNDDDNKSNGMFGGSDNEKERVKKMINYLEKIGSGFFLLKIHEQLIRLIDYAKVTYNNPKICSVDDINREIISRITEINKNRKPGELFINYEDHELKKYTDNLEKFKQCTMQRILNMSEGQLMIKKQIFNFVMDYVTNPKPLTNRKFLCLVGPPGVGKTFISLAIARILFFNEDENPSDDDIKLFVHILSIPALTDENTLLGSNSVYVGAKPGLLTREALFNDKLCRKLFIFDEIDKKSRHIEQLIPIFDSTQNSRISDNYLDCEVDLRTCVLIATANEKNNIHPILRDRLHIINVSGYNNYTKSKMVQTHILTKLLSESSIKDDILHIPLCVLETLINDRTREAGVRSLKNLVSDIIGKVKTGILYENYDYGKILNNFNNDLNEMETTAYKISDEIALNGKFSDESDIVQKYYKEFYEYDRYNIKEFYEKISKRYKKLLKLSMTEPNEKHYIILTKDDIDIIFQDKYKYDRDNIDVVTKWEPGKIFGLYATSMGLGGILPITVKLNKSLANKDVLVTLGAKETMKESAMISTMLVSDYIVNMYKNINNKNKEQFKKYFGINGDEFKEHIENVVKISSPHVILDSSTPKDGPSAGGAFMIAYLSKILNHTLSKNVGITGEISSNLKITAIGGLNMKINGAIIAGCRSVVAPDENKQDIIRELVYENSIDVKNEVEKRVAFIYKENNSYILLVRTSPQNDKNVNNEKIKLCAFDINVEYGKPEYLKVTEDHSKFVETDVPSLYKLKLNLVNDTLIDPSEGLGKNIIVYDTEDKSKHKHGHNAKYITLADIMKTHFVVFSLEHINEIYYYMVMSKHVYNGEKLSEIIDPVNIEYIEFDGNSKKNRETIIPVNTIQEKDDDNDVEN